MKFLPSLCDERGPVAETDVATVANGRGGTSFFMVRFGFSAAFVPTIGLGSWSTAFRFKFVRGSVGLSSISEWPALELGAFLFAVIGF